MRGPRHLFFFWCGAEMPKGWIPLRAPPYPHTNQLTLSQCASVSLNVCLSMSLPVTASYCLSFSFSHQQLATGASPRGAGIQQPPEM